MVGRSCHTITLFTGFWTPQFYFRYFPNKLFALEKILRVNISDCLLVEATNSAFQLRFSFLEFKQWCWWCFAHIVYYRRNILQNVPSVTEITRNYAWGVHHRIEALSEEWRDLKLHKSCEKGVGTTWHRTFKMLLENVKNYGHGFIELEDNIGLHAW